MSFMDGVNDGLKIIIKMFKVLFTFYILIICITKCGIIEDLSVYFKSDILQIILLFITRPLSSSSTLTMMINYFEVSGVDSNISIISSLIYASCDASVYIVCLYLSYLNIKSNKLTLYGILINVLSFFLIMLYMLLK